MIYPDPSRATEIHPEGLAHFEPDHAGRMPSYVEHDDMVRPCGEPEAAPLTIAEANAKHPTGWLLFLPSDLDAPEQSPEEWLAELFEFEFCAECSGDAQHHTVIRDPLGNYFARCNHAPADDGTPHPIVAAFRAEACN